MSLFPGLSVKNLYLYLMVLLLGVRAALSPTGLKFTDVDVHITFLALILYAFLTWAVWSAFEPTYSSWRAFIGLKSQIVDYYLIYFVFRYGVDTLADTLWVLRASVATILVTSAIVLIDYALGLHNFTVREGRQGGFFNEPNLYAALLVFFLPIAIATLQSFHWRARWFWWLLVAITIFLLLGTGSRGAWVGAIVGPLIAAWWLSRYVDFFAVLKVGGIALVVIAALVIVGVVVVEMEFIVTRVSRLWSQDATTASSGRLEIWAAALSLMRDWPYSFIFGFGWYSFSSSGLWKAAHSEYFRTFYELGIIGLGAYLILFAVLISRTRDRLASLPRRLQRLQISFLFGFVAMLIAIFFVDIPPVWPLIWPFVGLMLGIQAYGPRTIEESNDETTRFPPLSTEVVGGGIRPGSGEQIA
jgi:O-antigen ligase